MSNSQSCTWVVLARYSCLYRFTSVNEAAMWLKFNTSTKMSFRWIHNRLLKIHRKYPYPGNILGYRAFIIVYRHPLKEVWRTIKGFPYYQVSNYGSVRSLPRVVYRGTTPVHLRGCLRKQHITPRGYARINLHQYGKSIQFNVNDLVGGAFLPNPNHYKEINHNDECKVNNFAGNLIWCSRKYNVNYGHRTEKTYHPVKLVKGQKVFHFKSMICASHWLRFHDYTKASARHVRSNISDCASPKIKYNHAYGFTVKAD